VRTPAGIDPRAPLVRYVPSDLSRRSTELEELYEAIWGLGGPTVVWTDEAMAVSHANWAPRYFDLIQQQGAQLGIGHLVCSQRPVDVAPSSRTEADHIFLFVPVPHRLNLDPLAVEVGLSTAELERDMRELQEQEGEHSFLWYSRRDNELVHCAPVPLE
jgi:hypothetical protein